MRRLGFQPAPGAASFSMDRLKCGSGVVWAKHLFWLAACDGLPLPLTPSPRKSTVSSR